MTKLVSVTRADLAKLFMTMAGEMPFEGRDVTTNDVLAWMKKTLGRDDLRYHHAHAFAKDAGIKTTRKRNGYSSDPRHARAQYAAMMMIELAESLGHDVPERWRMVAEKNVSNEDLARAWRQTA